MAGVQYGASSSPASRFTELREHNREEYPHHVSAAEEEPRRRLFRHRVGRFHGVLDDPRQDRKREEAHRTKRDEKHRVAAERPAAVRGLLEDEAEEGERAEGADEGALEDGAVGVVHI